MNRINQMKDMRYVEGKTLQEIGDAFEISRERVRQLIGNTGKEFRREWTRTEIAKGLINLSDIHYPNELPGVIAEWRKTWGKCKHPRMGGVSGKGYKAELKAEELLTSLGYEVKQLPNRAPYDMEVNGLRVDVKWSHFDISNNETQSYRSPTYVIGGMKFGLDCDYFMVLLGDGDWFVIPSAEVTTDSIRIPWPILSKKGSKWSKYHEKFELLKGD